MAATVPVVVAPALGSHHGRVMLVYALLALGVLIAMLGTGNTPALSIFERTGWESVIIALQGTIPGQLIGVFFGWALVLAMKNQRRLVSREEQHLAGLDLGRIAEQRGECGCSRCREGAVLGEGLRRCQD